jgi:hypothetical protein
MVDDVLIGNLVARVGIDLELLDANRRAAST